MNEFIKKIELEFNISIIHSENRIALENIYATDGKGNIIMLLLYEVPLKKIDILFPICNYLKELSLIDCDINNVVLIEKFEQLETLDLSLNPISNLEGLDKLGCLKKLYLLGTRINSDSNFQNFQNLNNLEYLDLSLNRYIKSIAGLEQLKNLETLGLKESKIEHFDDIGAMEKLNNLNLNGSTNLDFSKINGLEKIQNLEILNLSCCSITTLKGLKGLKNLRQLYLNSSETLKIEHLGSLKNLKILDLGETYVSKIEGLEQLTNLMILNLSTTNISKIEGLDNLSNLKIVKLVESNISKIENDSFKGITNECIFDLSYSPIKSIDVVIPDNITIVLDFPSSSFLSFDVKDEDAYSERLKHRYFEHFNKRPG